MSQARVIILFFFIVNIFFVGFSRRALHIRLACAVTENWSSPPSPPPLDELHYMSGTFAICIQIWGILLFLTLKKTGTKASTSSEIWALRKNLSKTLRVHQEDGLSLRRTTIDTSPCKQRQYIKRRCVTLGIRIGTISLNGVNNASSCDCCISREFSRGWGTKWHAVKNRNKKLMRFILWMHRSCHAT